MSPESYIMMLAAIKTKAVNDALDVSAKAAEDPALSLADYCALVATIEKAFGSAEVHIIRFIRGC